MFCKILSIIVVVSTCARFVYLDTLIRYDTFTGKQLTEEEWRQHIKDNTTFWCVSEIQPCDPNERRRLDGSCNNLKHPSRGTAHTRFHRVLPPDFSKIYEPRKAKSGDPLPLTRRVRKTLLADGHVPSTKFTQLLTNFLILVVGDIVTVQDTVNYVVWKPYCCKAQGKKDFECAPNKIPEDDPVHRFSNIRCQVMTRPMSYQLVGCVRNDTHPERLSSATPVLDLSCIYGSLPSLTKERLRLYKGGLLNYEEENGRIWPPSYKTRDEVCLLNERPYETRCHRAPDDGINSIMGANLLSIWFWRYHNFIANKLSKINPCWNDDMLFDTTRDIVIGAYLQIVYYELMPALLGRENLLQDGVITHHEGFRDLYDERIIPQLSIEFAASLRWIHTIQNGYTKLYDQDGYYLKQLPSVNLTLRTGFLAKDNNIDYLTQGAFRQGSGHVDYIIDPYMGETVMGGVIRNLDVATNDLAKSRYYGFPPYVKYLEFCYGNKYESFDDLIDVIDPERIELLKENYNNIEDIDLTAGIWVEKIISGGDVPPTFYCLTVDHLKRNIMFDRHWYESSKRPYAFTSEQLQEIRKMSLARLLCNVGDTVKKIQPRAFFRAGGRRNKIQSCSNIPDINLNAWKDQKCALLRNI